jgi:ferrous iron transport protein B
VGLTAKSTGAGVFNDCGLHIIKEQNERVIALAGNPNVGKSTVFNSLTGLNQHTGNWPGKTVTNAQGRYRHKGTEFILVDLPGTYSLMANSAEEETARDFICFGAPDATVIVVDATCLERNLNLVLQTLEITGNAVVCVNLLDEAKKKKIRVDLKKLAELLGVPVVGTSARSGRGLEALMDSVEQLTAAKSETKPLQVTYDDAVEQAVAILMPAAEDVFSDRISSRWAALKLLEGDACLLNTIREQLGGEPAQYEALFSKTKEAAGILEQAGISKDRFRDIVVTKLVQESERIADAAVTFEKQDYAERDRRIDRILTSKLTGIPIMILMLLGVFWLTITGANIPSGWLSDGFSWLGDRLRELMNTLASPVWLTEVLVSGIYKTLTWVVSVMLPPMAIFFPLFTLLEDSGYLPRIAFNLDNFFRKACAHGKQALTMCMGFGCNAAGVIGCRIIDSPRERLIAIITNNFVPCNGRFPTLIAIITMFIAGAAGGAFGSAVSALALTGVILLGILMTAAVSKLLSKTILKGLPSAFNLELPPYRRPQIGRVIVRSIFDRTLFVLGRAAAVAAPAGLIIWLMANIQTGGASLLAHCAAFLDPFAKLMGLDGYILFAFILGFPANEIVVPIIIMSYTASGSLIEMNSLSDLRGLLTEHGWTWLTAVNTMLFSLMHWPCATACFTIKKETRSVKWTLISAAVPTAIGIIICMFLAAVTRLFGLV